MEGASSLQRPLSYCALRTVLKGPKPNGEMALFTLTERPSKPHAELPLHLFAGTPDQPDDAAT